MSGGAHLIALIPRLDCLFSIRALMISDSPLPAVRTTRSYSNAVLLIQEHPWRRVSRGLHLSSSREERGVANLRLHPYRRASRWRNKGSDLARRARERPANE